MGGELNLVEGVHAGMFRPLGTGDVQVDEVIVALETAGYSGWYVLEQDVALLDGVPPEGAGPLEDVRRSLRFITGHIDSRISAATIATESGQ
jgi:inosose dehydratase